MKYNVKHMIAEKIDSHDEEVTPVVSVRNINNNVIIDESYSRDECSDAEEEIVTVSANSNYLSLSSTQSIGYNDDSDDECEMISAKNNQFANIRFSNTSNQNSVNNIVTDNNGAEKLQKILRSAAIISLSGPENKQYIKFAESKSLSAKHIVSRNKFLTRSINSSVKNSEIDNISSSRSIISTSVSVSSTNSGTQQIAKRYLSDTKSSELRREATLQYYGRKSKFQSRLSSISRASVSAATSISTTTPSLSPSLQSVVIPTSSSGSRNKKSFSSTGSTATISDIKQKLTITGTCIQSTSNSSRGENITGARAKRTGISVYSLHVSSR